MISMGSESTGLGLTVRSLRETKGMSRGELARVVGISESYLKKIERGDRSPGLEIYRKITEVLDADISIRNSDGTVKGECAARAHKIFLESTEKQAVFLIQVLEFMAQNIKAVK
jgi:Predicted transcriptional regulator with C-terminal CBS domains